MGRGVQGLLNPEPGTLEVINCLLLLLFWLVPWAGK